MKKFTDELNSITEAFKDRAADKLDKVQLAAFVSEVKDLQKRFAHIIEKESKTITNVKEENEVLRSIAGMSETELHAKAIEQLQEAQFLRTQLIGTNKKVKKLIAENNSLRLEIENLKNEIARGQFVRDANQFKFQEEFDEFKGKINLMRDTYQKEKDKLSKDKKRLMEHGRQIEESVRKWINLELFAVIGRVRDLIGITMGTAQYCVERWGSIKKEASKKKGRKKKLSLGVLKRREKKPLDEVSPDLHLVHEFCNKALKTLDQYVELLTPIEPRWNRMSWSSFWDRMRNKYFDAVIKYQVKITLPNEKRYPDFVTDENILTEICDILLQNSLEAVSRQGSIEVKGYFKEDETTLHFTDNGKGIRERDIDRVFLPFFTTKSDHTGLGLTRALKLAKLIDGAISCEPAGQGSMFILTVLGREEK